MMYGLYAEGKLIIHGVLYMMYGLYGKLMYMGFMTACTQRGKRLVQRVN